MKPTYDSRNHRSDTFGYRNKTTINSFVKWANKILDEKFPDKEIVLIGFKSSGAYLGVPLALSRDCHYISPTINDKKDAAAELLLYLGRNFKEKYTLIFIDDYIHFGTTISKVSEFISLALVLDYSDYCVGYNGVDASRLRSLIHNWSEDAFATH